MVKGSIGLLIKGLVNLVGKGVVNLVVESSWLMGLGGS